MCCPVLTIEIDFLASLPQDELFQTGNDSKVRKKEDFRTSAAYFATSSNQEISQDTKALTTQTGCQDQQIKIKKFYGNTKENPN